MLSNRYCIWRCFTVESVIFRSTAINRFTVDNMHQGGIGSVRQFTLENQQISYMANFFSMFPHLDTIIIRNCEVMISVSVEGQGPFATQKPLKLLSIYNNTFVSDPPGKRLLFFQRLIGNLNVDIDTEIELVHNDLVIGKNAMDYLKSISFLKRLSLRGCVFQDYQSLIGVFDEFDNLEILDLGDTRLPALHPGTLNGMRNLRRLYLDHNDLRNVQYMNFFEGLRAVNLSFLDASYNRLHDLPQGFEEYGKNLLTYNLDGNQIESSIFKDRQQYFPRLYDLSESHNIKASFLGKTFNTLATVKRIDMSCNPFRQLDLSTFAGMHSYERINFTFCCSSVRTRPMLMYDTFEMFPLVDELHLGSGFLKTVIFEKLQVGIWFVLTRKHSQL